MLIGITIYYLSGSLSELKAEVKESLGKFTEDFCAHIYREPYYPKIMEKVMDIKNF